MVNETKDRIITGADELFMRLGIKSVTMDDIASHLAVSKKTIYQNFKDKDALVIAVSEVHMAQDHVEVEKLVKESENAIQELFFISQYIKTHVAKMNPSILFDLKKYHPKAWDLFQKHQVDCIASTVIKNIERGKKEGTYREGVNAEILAVLRMQSVEMAFNPVLYPVSKFDLMEVNMQLFEHFVYGMVTTKGAELYNKYLDENQ